MAKEKDLSRCLRLIMQCYMLNAGIRCFRLPLSRPVGVVVQVSRVARKALDSEQ